MNALSDTVARLAAGSRGRTEADIQSDVRTFLLHAPLELAADQVIDVALEAQAGGGRRIDVEAGCAVIEVKKNLRSDTVVRDAVDQLAMYVRQRTEERTQRYVGVLTDGETWALYHLEPRGALAKVSEFTLRAQEPERLAAWLEPVLATRDRLRPTPKEIVRRLGADSTAAQLDLADLHALYQRSQSEPEVQLKRELWARLLLTALGTNFQDSDDLFVTHTYLVLAAELIAHQVMHLPVDAPDGDVRALLEGHQFAVHGIHGVVEPDFFDWPAAVPEGRPIIAGIARRLGSFDWSDVQHDVLKALYESVIDADTRRRLGEYYTPDWLADKIVTEQFQDPVRDRLLDPACGSGTFLFWAVRRALAAYAAAGIPNRDALNRVVRHVQGIDLHPVAVTLARVTYLLALTPERLADRDDDLTIPVFLSDSVGWGHDDIRLDAEGMTVRTSDPTVELVEDTLHFPEGILEEPARFDSLVAELAARAARRRRNTKPPKIAGLLNRHRVVGESDRAAVQTAFQKLCRLHDKQRDHVWSYYIRNRARPLSFMRPDGRADLLVGNPPWLAYRSMPARLQRRYRSLAVQRGLWAGGKVATHQDLSDLFVARCVEQYLRPKGRFAFVMPYAVLSRRQFAGFRTGHWIGEHAGTRARLGQPEDFAHVKPPPFQMPCCVITGAKDDDVARPLPTDAITWIGRVASDHIDWTSAAAGLKPHDAAIARARDSSESPYRSRFVQGASLVPRVLLTVERGAAPGRLGIAAGRMAVRSARSANEKEPWKKVRSLEAVIERQFVRPMHLGATIVAHRARTPQLAIIPYVDGKLLDGSSERLDEFPGLAAWWRKAEETWVTNKSEATRLSLRAQIDFRNKLSKQFPIPPHRVVYTKSGQHLAACRIEDATAVIDHKLYWAAVDSVDEGRFLCAVLNSRILAEVVSGLQARGQHNPRDFDMHVFALPFPLYDPRSAEHMALARLARRAETVAAEVQLNDAGQFQTARRVTRDALHEDGVSAEIDQAVAELILDSVSNGRKSTPRPRGARVPDLIGAISDAMAARKAPPTVNAPASNAQRPV